MEIILLACVIGFLLAFIVFKELLQYKERDTLTKKILSKNFVEYSSAELAEKEINNKKVVEHKTPKYSF